MFELNFYRLRIPHKSKRTEKNYLLFFQFQEKHNTHFTVTFFMLSLPRRHKDNKIASQKNKGKKEKAVNGWDNSGLILGLMALDSLYTCCKLAGSLPSSLGPLNLTIY